MKTPIRWEYYDIMDEVLRSSCPPKENLIDSFISEESENENI